MIMPRLLQGLVGLCLLALLAGCGFQPLYGTSGLSGDSVSTKLASVAIPEQRTRVGQLIRNEILAAVAPAGTATTTVYRLDMTPKTSDDTAVEAQNTDVLRRSYRLNVSFALVESASGKQVYSGKTFSYVSYDRTGAPFANLQALANAEERAAQEAGLDIRTRLAAYFATN
jgi:LPS-assembly lipoprotein